MRFAEVERIVLDAVELLVSVGVSREAASLAMKEAEKIAILDLVETAADERFLDLFDKYGSAAAAERKKVSQRTINNYRREALERQARKKIGNAASGSLAA